MDKKRLIPDLWIATALFFGNLLILGPYLLADFSDQPWNNGYVHMATARMFHDHQWTWDPLHYGGAPFHYRYPPIFHVLMGAMPVVSFGRAFHLLAGLGYLLVPVCIYVLGMQLFRSRLLAAFAAVAYSVFPSPVYYFLPQWGGLALPYAHAPWGFVALIGYDEAAHSFALPIALLAFGAAWRNRWLIASLLAAAVLLTNWPALIGLGFGMAGIAIARTRDLGALKAASSVAATVGIAYGLSSFWMTPGYFVSSTLLNRTVLRHTPLPAAPWHETTWLILLVAACLVGLALWRRVSPALALLLTWVALSGAVVVGFTLAGNHLLPSPNRYMLEFNLGAVLAVAGLISLATPKWRAALVAAATIAGGVAAFGFVTHAWKVQPHSQDPRTGVAYQIADWLNRHAGGSRVCASGELDSTLALWSDVPQVGGSGQDVSNFLVFAAERQVAFGCGADSARVAELWLRALNVRYFVVHHAGSREHFHWYAQPEKFDALPVAWDSGAGDTVYHVPGLDPHDAVVVDLPALSRLPRLRSTSDPRFLEAYVEWASGKRPAPIHWNSVDSADIEATLEPDEAILVKSNYDPGWRASNGSIENDPIGFLLIRSRQGQQHLKLQFGASWDVWLGRAITALTIILLLARVPRTWIAAAAVVPALAAYWLLLSSAPPTVAVAEDAFRRLQPPMINPQGIVDAITNQQPPFDRGRLLAVYGLNFGAKTDAARVWLDDRPVEPEYHGRNFITFKLPSDASPKPRVSVEVNGCRGNAFVVAIRNAP